MRNFKINTTLGVVPSMAASRKKASYFITRGSTATLTFDLAFKAYTFNQIEQLTFLLKEPSGKISKYEMYDAQGEMNLKFKHQMGVNFNYVSLTLDPKETAALELTKNKTPIEFEVVVKIDGDDFDPNKKEYTQIETQPSIGTIDSLYGQLIGE